MMSKMRNHKNGVALLHTLIFIVFVVGFIEVVTLEANRSLILVNRNADLKRAYYVADAGLAAGFMQLRSYTNPPTGFNLTDNNFSIGGGKTGSYAVNVSSDMGAWPTYTIQSSGTFANITKTLTIEVKVVSISRWAYLSQTQSGAYFGPGESLEGPVHTNGQFGIWGDPVFDGPVTQVNSQLKYHDQATDNPDFIQGFTPGVPSIALPTTQLISSIQTGAGMAGGLSLTGDSKIIFRDDGTMDVTNSALGWTNHNISLPSNNGIYVNGGSATVQGVLNGQVTVGSSNNIYIDGHITYNVDPRTDSSSEDLLGLVANNNVIVTTAAPPNLVIQAVVVALTGSFKVDQYGSGSYRGAMVQYGGQINYASAPTGTVSSGGTWITGYSQVIAYDERLQNIIPPYFTPAVDNTGRITYTKVKFVES